MAIERGFGAGFDGSPKSASNGYLANTVRLVYIPAAAAFHGELSRTWLLFLWIGH
jgi:hypothetical protein